MLSESSYTFVLSAGRRFGLGHARRMQSVASVLLNRGIEELRLKLLGTSYDDAIWPDIVRAVGAPIEISEYPTSTKWEMQGGAAGNAVCDATVRFTIGEHKNAEPCSVVFFDLVAEHATFSPDKWATDFSKARCVVGIDHVAQDATWPLDLRWVPSFHRSEKWPADLDIKSGWDNYLLVPPKLSTPRKPARNVLVLTGGSDPLELSESWPSMLAELATPPLQLTWVQGPFSRTPHFPHSCRHTVEIVHAPERLDDFFLNADVVLTVHGISVFEALSYRRRVVTYCPKNTLSNGEIEALRKSNVVFVATEAQRAVEMVTAALRAPLPPQVIDGLGAERLVDSVERLLQARQENPKVVAEKP